MVLPPALKEHRVLLAGKGEKILDLVLRQAPPKQWAQWLRLPLSVAAAEGDLTCVTELLAAGADGSAGQRDRDGSTLLHAAAKGGNEKVILSSDKSHTVGHAFFQSSYLQYQQ